MRLQLLRKLQKNQSGIAAIEAALILPVLLLLYFGLFDLTGLITIKRKLTYTTNAVADLVTQNDGTVSTAQINDYFEAAELMMRPFEMDDVRIEIHVWRPSPADITTGSIAWSRASSTGSSCGAPTTASINPLNYAQSSDLVVAVMCTTYTPYVGTFLGEQILGATQFSLRDQIVLRPRQTTQLNCTDC